MVDISRRDFCASCLGSAFLPAACGASVVGDEPSYRSTLIDGVTPPTLFWSGREWRANMGSTWTRGMDHSLRLTRQKARFEVRPSSRDRREKDRPGTLRSELSGSVKGDPARLPNGVPLWGAMSFIHRRWSDPEGMATRTGGVHGQVHMGSKFGGSPALAFRRDPAGLFRITTRGEHDAESRTRYSGPLSFDQVHDVVYRVVLHPTRGALSVWLDGSKILGVSEQSIGSHHADSFWIVGCYYSGGATCPVVAEYAHHQYPDRADLSSRIARRPAWPAA